MKRLLLTLLGVTALCGLSPHPAAAQTTTASNTLHMDFNKRVEGGHNDDLTFSGILQTLTSSNATTVATVCTFYDPDTKRQWPTTDAGLFPYIKTAGTSSKANAFAYKQANNNAAYPTYSSGADYDGVKIIENNDLKLEFNYKYAIARTMTAANNRIHFASQIRVGKAYDDTEETDEGGLYLFPGVTFKLTPKVGKKIKKITIKTPYESTVFTSARLTANFYVYNTPDDEDFSTANVNTYTNTSGTITNSNAKITYGTYTYNSTTRAQAEITFPDSYPGEYSPEAVVLGLKQTGLYPYNYATTQPNTYAAITISNITTLREAFGISSIDVEYYNEEELPKYVRTLTCGKDNGDEIEVEKDGSFVSVSTLSETTLSDDLVKLRIGDAIVEIARTASSPSGKPTVTFDTERGWVGAHAYSTIKAYPDPDKYQYHNSQTLPYNLTYYVNGYITNSEKLSAALQSSKNMAYNTEAITGVTVSRIAADASAPRIITLSKLEGIPSTTTLTVRPIQTTASNWGAPFSSATSSTATSVTSAAYTDASDGTAPAFAFDGITFIIPSDMPNPPAKPGVTTDLGDAALSGGIWRSTTPFNLTLSESQDDYDNHKIEYIISETPVDVKDLDWSAAEAYNAPIAIGKSCFVYARICSDYDGQQCISDVTTIQMEILETTMIASLADLHKAENDGKTVTLQMPLIVNVNAKVYPEGSAYGYTQAAYLRDIDGNGVKVISRRAAASEDAFPTPSYTQASQATTNITLMNENTVVGVYRYNDGVNPCIVIRDNTLEEPIDYYDYQGHGTTSITDQIELLKAIKYATDQEYNTITPDIYGKRVFVRGLTDWNDADRSFTVIAAGDNDPFKTIKLRVGTSTDGALSSMTTLPATLSADKVYDIQAILEFDPEANDGEGEYYLAPIQIYQQFDMPSLTGPEEIKEKTTDITAEDGTTVIGVEYTDDFKDGTIRLTFKAEMPAVSTRYLYWMMDTDSGSNIAKSTHISNLEYTFEVKTTALTFDEESGSATVYVYCREQSVGSFNTQNSGQRFKVVIRDAVQNGPKVTTAAELREKVKSGEIDPSKGEYVQFRGRFAIVAKYGTTMVLRDVDASLPLDPAKVADAADIKKAFSESYIVINDDSEWIDRDSNTGFISTYRSYSGNNLWLTGSRQLRVGDEVTGFIGQISTDAAGNLHTDLSGLSKFFYSTALYEYTTEVNTYESMSVNGFSRGEVRFMPYMTTGEKNEKNEWIIDETNPVTHPVNKALSEITTDPLHPDNVKFDDSMLDTELHVMNVAVREKASDDPDAATDYEAVVTADGLTLLWDMFGTDRIPSEPATAAVMALADDTESDDTAEPAKSVKEQLAAHLANGETAFNVRGVLRKHTLTTDGEATVVYALQVESIMPTPKDVPALFYADGEKIEGDSYEFVKRIDLTTDMPDEALIKMTVGDGEQETYDPEKLKSIEANTKVTIERWVPGTIKIDPTTITLTKLSTDVNTLAEVAGGDNANDLYHFRSHLKVVAAAEGTVMAADKEGNLAVVAAAPAEAAEGKYLADIVLVRNSKNTASVHEIDADAELLDENDEYAIATPAPATLFGATVAEGNATDAEGNTYAIDPTFAAIPEGDAEAWKLTGYVLADDNDKPVIYLTASQAIDRVALPVITPAEAAFLDKTTVSITCATEGAAIEYSLDGGKTWNPYTGAFDATASGEILARATADDMLPSHEAKASVVREYLSGDVTITVDEQDGKTVITITGPAGAAIYYSLDGAADKLYDKEITIDNETQKELSGIIRAYAVEEGKRPGTPNEESYKVSGISGVGADQEAGSVRVEGNSIIVPEGAQTFDIAGRRVNPQGLPRGIYIVRLASGKAVKAVVK